MLWLLTSQAMFSKAALLLPGCHKGTIEEANAAGLVEVWLLVIITSRHESLDQPNQADVIFYPVSLSRHISWVDAQIAAAEKHPWPKINPHAPQIIAGLALLNLWYTTTSRVQNKNNKLSLMRHWKITWKCAVNKKKKKKKAKSVKHCLTAYPMRFLKMVISQSERKKKKFQIYILQINK